MKCLDIGCGRKKSDGFIGIDFSSLSDADITLDLNTQPLPFEDSTIDFVFSSHALEHLSSEGFQNVIKEIYRVLKPGCQFKLAVPYYSTSLNLANPFHNNNICFNEHTFRFYSSEKDCHALTRDEWSTPSCPQWGLRYSANAELGIEFRTESIEFYYFPEYQSLDEDQRFLFRQTRNNVVDQIVYTLTCIKPCPIRPDTGPVSPPTDTHKLITTQLAYLRDQVSLIEARKLKPSDLGVAKKICNNTQQKGDLYRVDSKLTPAKFFALELDYYIQILQRVIDNP